MKPETNTTVIVQARTEQTTIQREQDLYTEILAMTNTRPVFVNPLLLEIDGKQTSESAFIEALSYDFQGLPIILGGSGDAGFQEEVHSEGYRLAMQYSERTNRFIREAYANDAALLAICFGHQAAAFALREPGSPNNIVKQGKVGTYEFALTHAGQQDYIFKGVQDRHTAIQMVYGHSGQIIVPPPGFTVLGSVYGEATTDFYSALAKNKFRTFQGHPELYTSHEAKISAGLAGYHGDFEEPSDTKQIVLNFLRENAQKREELIFSTSNAERVLASAY